MDEKMEKSAGTTPAPESDVSAPVPEESTGLEARVIQALKTCYDPEIPVDIYELGLIYDLEVKPGGSVQVQMTLTSPMCPVAESLPPEVESKIRAVPGVTDASVEVVWDPPWSMEKMSEAARLQLGML